jgi:DNA-binding NarL/FixJ family response regulator
MALRAQVTDLRGLGLAAATAAVNLILGVAVLKAVAVAVLVLGVKVIAGLLWPKPVAETIAIPVPGAPRTAAQLLSPAERQIATMVGGGLKNRQIAALLHKSERTVDNQVHSILNKLGFENRSQIAVWANRHGLIERKPDEDLPPKI